MKYKGLNLGLYYAIIKLLLNRLINKELSIFGSYLIVSSSRMYGLGTINNDYRYFFIVHIEIKIKPLTLLDYDI